LSSARFNMEKISPPGDDVSRRQLNVFEELNQQQQELRNYPSSRLHHGG